MRRAILFTVILALCATFVFADTMETSRLNYFNGSDTGSANRTLSYTSSQSFVGNVTIVVPPPFNFTVTDDCGLTQPGGAICTCTSATLIASCVGVPSGGTVTVAVSPFSPFPLDEYTLSVATGNITNSTGGQLATPSLNASFIRIKEDEIFHTLVEFGRGRGNYFFDSLGRTGSMSTGTGYPYVPNATRFELNYLHKVFGLKQYYGLASAVAGNATFNCVYPNNTVVRIHLASEIIRAGTFDNTYLIPEIGGSFERQSFMGQDFDEDESISVGNNFTVNCTNLNYQFPQAGGNISVGEDAFTLTYRNPEPFNISAVALTSAVGNGSQEVDIVYTIHNLEVYPVDDVRLELKAPDLATFIGVKGELWGTGLDKYIFERTRMGAGTTETITLTARFNTTGTSGLLALNLSGLSVFEYITPWEINAYNPVQSVQYVQATANVTVDLTLNTSILNIKDTIYLINQTVIENNRFLQTINNTVQIINNTLNNINNTIAVLNNTVQAINFTVNNIQNQTSNILSIEEIDILDVSATLFRPEDVIIVDAIFLTSKAVPISGAMCNISLRDSTFTTLIANASMTERPIAGIPHYTYNATNISALGGATVGKFFGHVRCRDGNKPAVYREADFEVRPSSTTVDLSAVTNKLNRMSEFDEEMVFLVTDSFGLRDEARTDAMNGRNGDAIEKLTKANEQLNEVAQRLGNSRDQLLSSTATPDAAPANAPESGSSGSVWDIFGDTSYLWAAIIILVAVLIYMFKHEHVHEEPEF